jgi:F1F0 ATPase subunit 2
MSDLWGYTLAVSAGLVIGLFYFGGLWLTMRHLPKTQRPTLLLIASFFGRLGLSLAAFVVVANGRWQRLLVAILAFFVMRFILVNTWGVEREEEVKHGPEYHSG